MVMWGKAILCCELLILTNFRLKKNGKNDSFLVPYTSLPQRWNLIQP